MLFINTILALSLSSTLSVALCMPCTIAGPSWQLCPTPSLHTQSQSKSSSPLTLVRCEATDKTRQRQSRFSPWPRAAAATSIQFLLAE